MRAVAGVDRAREAVFRVVCDFQGMVEIADLEKRQDRAEDLFLREAGFGAMSAMSIDRDEVTATLLIFLSTVAILVPNPVQSLSDFLPHPPAQHPA